MLSRLRALTLQGKQHPGRDINYGFGTALGMAPTPTLWHRFLQATETAQKQQTSALTMSSPGLRAWGLHMPAPTSPTIPGGTPSHTLLPDAGVSPISHSPGSHTNTPCWFWTHRSISVGLGWFPVQRRMQRSGTAQVALLRVMLHWV